MSPVILNSIRNFLSLKELKKTQIPVILTVAVFIMVSGNLSLFNGITNIYPVTLNNIPLLISLFLFFFVLTAMFFLMICQSKFTRWLLAGFLIVTAISAYYMDHFGVIIDTVMIDNMMNTDTREFMGLMSETLLFRIIIFGVVPAWLVMKYTPRIHDYKVELKYRVRLVSTLLVMIVLLVIPFTADYTSFFREHKITRYYANPTYSVYSAVKFAIPPFVASRRTTFQKVATDAINLDPASSRKELIILVVGETARADRFSLNGYKRITNPLLSKQDVVSFTNATSCGTSTGVSVPCMFSALGRKHYDKEKALDQENALDVLARNGIEVLWRDNNSDSKGVATRMEYQDFKTPTNNPDCDTECRDIGMLSGLEDYIQSRKDKDILIVLHQMGNHGPEYYRRYPKSFERFTPACQTGELRNCSRQEIDNAYDNAILYTDYFLSEVINFLKKFDNRYETAMLYLSDHGESLGEKNIYLHAAPYSTAPKEQTAIPAIAWVGKNFDYKLADIKPYKNIDISQDDLFCTLLVSYEVVSNMCEAKNGMLNKNINLKSYAYSEALQPKSIN